MGMLASRSCLVLVNRVMRETGLPDVTTFTDTNSIIALEALNDCVADIWQRQRWTFQRYTSTIQLVDSQQDYTLPEGFDRMASPFRTSGTLGLSNLQELTPEVWWELGLGDSTNIGQPLYYTIDVGVARFSPIPNSDFVAICPSFQYQYFKGVQTRRTTSDTASSWDLPLDFEDAMVNFGKARLKKFLEYPDWGQDMESYERNLKTLRDKYREVRVAPEAFTGETPMVW